MTLKVGKVVQTEYPHYITLSQWSMWNTDMLSLLSVQNISRVNWSSVLPSYYLD